MNSSRTKLVLMALLGSIAVSATLLLLLDPGSPPVGSQLQGRGDRQPAEGLVSDPMAGETAVTVGATR